MTPRALAVLALAGCGSASAHVADAGPDAPPSGDVTVTTMVRSGDLPAGTPQAGVQVIVVQPDGTRGDSGLTDVQGMLTLHGVQQGAGVSAAYAQSFTVTSFVGVQPGDHLTFGDPYAPPTFTLDRMIYVKPIPDVDGAALWIVATGCGRFDAVAPTSALQMPFAASCTGSTGPLLVAALDGAGNPLASAYLPQAAFVPESTITIPPVTPNAPDNFAISISGLSDAVAFLGFDVTAAYDHSVALPVALTVLTPETTPSMASATATIPSAPPRIVVHADLVSAAEAGIGLAPFGNVDTYRTISGTGTGVSLLAPTLPMVGDILADTAVSQATWLQTAGSYDGAVLRLFWTSNDPHQGLQSHTWTVILPPGQTSFDLNGPLAVFPPGQLRSPSVQLIDVASVHGYDELRALPEWQITDVLDAVNAGDLDAVDTATSVSVPTGAFTSARSAARAGSRASSR